VVAGCIYFAPANYHLVIENDKTFSLNIDRKINFSRPSIDCLFFSASDVYRDKLLGILLTGANNDGAKGMKYIQINGGLTIVQDPKDAEVSSMPMSAIEIMKPDWILPLNKIAEKLMNL
jgi:two-component system chemotaxis response regulator CheB